MFVKKTLTLLISLCIFFLCSCNKEYDPVDWASDDYPFAEETMLTVLKCFDEKDKETLKSLFSESVASKYDLDKQIDEAMNCYNGKSVTHDDVGNDINAADFRKDHYAYKSIWTDMDHIITDNNKVYRIIFEYILVNEEDKTQIGLSKLFLRDPNNPNENICSIGGNPPDSKK